MRTNDLCFLETGCHPGLPLSKVSLCSPSPKNWWLLAQIIAGLSCQIHSEIAGIVLCKMICPYDLSLSFQQTRILDIIWSSLWREKLNQIIEVPKSLSNRGSTLCSPSGSALQLRQLFGAQVNLIETGERIFWVHDLTLRAFALQTPILEIYPNLRFTSHKGDAKTTSLHK